jgi:hypothetical protein
MSKKSSKRQSNWDLEDYRNWPIAKLRDELENHGVKTGAGFPLQILRKLYQENVLNNPSDPKRGRVSDPGLNSPSTRPTNRSINTADLTAQTGAAVHTASGSHDSNLYQILYQRDNNTTCVPPLDNFGSASHDFRTGTDPGQHSSFSPQQTAATTTSPLTNTPGSSSVTSSANLTGAENAGLAMAPILTLATTMLEKMSALIPANTTQQTPTFDLASYYKKSATGTITANHTTVGRARFGTAPDAVPHMDAVSPSIRRAILEGKDINLACLLIPYFEMENKDDARLKRALTITEFITAFGRYKRIMCTAFPDRREELDHYEAHVVHLHRVYGDRYYEYHKLFSMKSANALQLHQIKIDWSQADRDLLQLVASGATTSTCAICKEVSHDTTFCPLNSELEVQVTQSNLATNTTRQNPEVHKPTQKSSSSTEDMYGRAIHYINNKPICNNFNTEAGCKRQYCSNTHVCIRCQSARHGIVSCSYAKDNTKKPQRST